MTSFQRGFKDLAQQGNFCWDFKNSNKIWLKSLSLSKYNILTQNKYYSCLEKPGITTSEQS